MRPGRGLAHVFACATGALVLLLAAGITECDTGDADGDGYTEDEGDCNDTNASVYPGAPEVCDMVDNDCDDQVDEEGAFAWYLDADGDRFGDARTDPVRGCTPPSEAYATNDLDCDDTDPGVHPYVLEVCNGVDDDCNGLVDDSPVRMWYRDQDADGYGVESQAVRACSQPPGYVADRGDCDDSDPSVHPFASDVPRDRVDQDCGGTDDADVSVPSSAYTIQEALENAQDGQVIWVGPGTYREHDLDFLGKAVTLISTRGWQATTIDAQGLGPVLTFVHEEGPDSRLDGFTLTHGVNMQGGGLYLLGASPTIQHVSIDSNTGTLGGGLAMEDSNPVFTDVICIRNVAQEGTEYAQGYGGCMYLYQSNPTFERLLVADNLSDGESGGVVMYRESVPTFVDAVFYGNVSDGRGGGLFVRGQSTPTFVNATFVANTAKEGGGFAVESSPAAFFNVFVAWNVGDYEGGGIYTTSSETTMANLLVVSNRTPNEVGGGVYSENPYEASVTNALILDNRALVVGGVYTRYGSQTWKNTILYANSGYNLYVHDTALSLSYCDLFPGREQANYSGVALDDTCSTVSPEFLGSGEGGLPVDPHLATTSPLVDAGDPDILDADGSRSDMGALGGPDGGHWDLDWDGYPNWFWPGDIEDAPPGFDPADYDSNDLDPRVH